MKLYHATQKINKESILNQGLLPGSVVGKKEHLPFVMFAGSPDGFSPNASLMVEVEIPTDDPKLRKVNESWYEFHGSVVPDQITAIRELPASNDEFFTLLAAYGGDYEVMSKNEFSWKTGGK